MDKVTLLHHRLKQIAESLEEHPNGLGLMGLGSAGADISRLDKWSDLDFFAIVAIGSKQAFIDDLCWLSRIQTIAWCFKNTDDGYKLLFDDGVFCEFAVFEAQELPHVSFIDAEFIWRDKTLEETLVHSTRPPVKASTDKHFLLGELLTNLYVGLCRFQRGEHTSAMRFIQVYALDRLIALLDLQTDEHPQISKDGFCPDRRVEMRHPNHRQLFANALQGALKSIASAEAILDFTAQQYLAEMPEYQPIINEIRYLLTNP